MYMDTRGTLYVHIILLYMHKSYKVIEDVPLMNMDGDKRLIFYSLHFSQVLCSDFNQCIQHVEKIGVGGTHNLFVGLCSSKCCF